MSLPLEGSEASLSMVDIGTNQLWEVARTEAQVADASCPEGLKDAGNNGLQVG